jgi:hypothetical protein
LSPSKQSAPHEKPKDKAKAKKKRAPQEIVAETPSAGALAEYLCRVISSMAENNTAWVVSDKELLVAGLKQMLDCFSAGNVDQKPGKPDIAKAVDKHNSMRVKQDGVCSVQSQAGASLLQDNAQGIAQVTSWSLAKNRFAVRSAPEMRPVPEDLRQAAHLMDMNGVVVLTGWVTMAFARMLQVDNTAELVPFHTLDITTTCRTECNTQVGGTSATRTAYVAPPEVSLACKSFVELTNCNSPSVRLRGRCRGDILPPCKSPRYCRHCRAGRAHAPDGQGRRSAGWDGHGPAPRWVL